MECKIDYYTKDTQQQRHEFRQQTVIQVNVGKSKRNLECSLENPVELYTGVCVQEEGEDEMLMCTHEL